MTSRGLSVGVRVNIQVPVKAGLGEGLHAVIKSEVTIRTHRAMIFMFVKDARQFTLAAETRQFLR